MEQNVIFNEDDVLTTNDIAIILGDVLAEGKRDKIIQNPLLIPTLINKKSINLNQVTMEEKDELPQLGWGHSVQKKPPGAYQCMVEAKPPLVASVRVHHTHPYISVESLGLHRYSTGIG